MISRVIKVEVGVISRSRKLRLITLTKSNNCFIIHSTKKKVMTVSGADNLFVNV